MKHKVFKIIISLLAIIGLVLPSYATISSSDGSAFVTKTEFDSALADFNNRLTTFEAGINSKIDSQVTSYLDRNGIWSGKDQVLSSDWSTNSTKITEGKCYSSFFNSGNTYATTLANAQSRDSTMTNTTSYLGLSQLVWSAAYNQYKKIGTVGNVIYNPGTTFIKVCSKTWTVVPNLTKSGLCHVQNLYETVDSGYDRSGFVFLIVSPNNSSFGNTLQSWLVKMAFYQFNEATEIAVNSTPKGTVTFCEALPYYPVGKTADLVSTQHAHGTNFSLNQSPDNLYFFVEKGKKLFARIEVYSMLTSNSLSGSLSGNLPSAATNAGSGNTPANWHTRVVIY